MPPSAMFPETYIFLVTHIAIKGNTIKEATRTNNIYGQQDKSLNDTLSKAGTHVRRPLPSDLKQRLSFALRRTVIARTPEATPTYPNNLLTSVQLTHTETRVIPRVPRHVPRQKFL